MSILEDVRQGLQDVVAPDLRAIKAQLNALEKRVDELSQRMDRQFDKVEAAAERRHEQLLMQMVQVANYAVVVEQVKQIREKQESLEKRLEQ